MHLNTLITVTGCITQEKFLRGRSLAELERLLGFHVGRLSEGMIVAALMQVPQSHQFEFRGYTQVATHRFNEEYGKVDYDKELIKQKVINEVFTIHGPNRLVKVMANIRHNGSMSPKDQYPAGLGIPQWEINEFMPIPAMVISIITDYPNGRYIK